MAVSLSTKPWSNYTEADYTLEQWHNACLIHQHTGPPTSKAQCKLPVKTPAGALNRDGCIAAAGALAGARSPLNASAEEKRKAAKTLITYYGKFDMKPTPMMLSLAHFNISDFIIHYGIRGMHWGIRRVNPSSSGEVSVKTRTKPAPTKISTKGGEHLPAHPDAVAARIVEQKLKKSGQNALSNKELQQLALRLNLEQQVTRLQNSQTSPGKKFVNDLMGSIAKQSANTITSQIVAKQVGSLLKKGATTAAVTAVT